MFISIGLPLSYSRRENHQNLVRSHPVRDVTIDSDVYCITSALYKQLLFQITAFQVLSAGDRRVRDLAK